MKDTVSWLKVNFYKSGVMFMCMSDGEAVVKRAFESVLTHRDDADYWKEADEKMAHDQQEFDRRMATDPKFRAYMDTVYACRGDDNGLV